MHEEMEWEKRRERTMTGRSAAVKAGKIKAITNHHLRYGWKWEDPQTKEKIVADEEKAKIVKWMAELYANGTGTVTIRNMLKARGIPSPKIVDKDGKVFEWSDYTIMSIISD